MTRYDLYVFFLCTVVFLALTILFSVLLASIIKLTLRVIRNGLDDKEILKEKIKADNQSRRSRTVNRLMSALVSIILMLVLVVIVVINLSGVLPFDNMPAMRVVKSDSMSQKNPGNDYLAENTLDDQIKMFDLILTHKLPDEFDLQLYDVVVYQAEEFPVIHRIVGIKESNDAHPGERRFILQGDAASGPDRFSVSYDQMEGIYKGERIPFVGRFVMFMQSPAGWLCILLVIFAIIVSPIVEKRILGEKKLRLKIIEAEDAQEPAD